MEATATEPVNANGAVCEFDSVDNSALQVVIRAVGGGAGWPCRAAVGLIFTCQLGSPGEKCSLGVGVRSPEAGRRRIASFEGSDRR